MKPAPAIRLLILLLTIASSATAQGIGIPHQTFTLPNGLRLIVHEDHSVPMAAVNVRCLEGAHAVALAQVEVRLDQPHGPAGRPWVAPVETYELSASFGSGGSRWAHRHTGQDFAAETRRATEGEGVHVVYDSVGRSTFVKGLTVIRPRGMMVLFGQSSGAVDPIDPQLLNRHGSLFLTRPTLVNYVGTREELLWRSGELFDLISRDELSVRIGAVYPLEEAGEAEADAALALVSGAVITCRSRMRVWEARIESTTTSPADGDLLRGARSEPEGVADVQRHHGADGDRGLDGDGHLVGAERGAEGHPHLRVDGELGVQVDALLPRAVAPRQPLLERLPLDLDEDAAARVGARLRERLAAGAYAADTLPASFAGALTRDMYAVSQDLHMRLSYEPSREFTLTPSGMQGPAPGGGSGGVVRTARIDPRDSATIARGNFGYERVERLPGNVGYLKLNEFQPLDYARETAAAAMRQAMLNSEEWKRLRGQ